MKKCMACGEIIFGEDKFCRNCGSSYIVPYSTLIEDKTASAKSETKDALSGGTKVTDSFTCSQFLLGIGINIIFNVVIAIIMFSIFLVFDGYDSESLTGVVIAYAFSSPLFLLYASLGVLGWKGEFSWLNFLGILLLIFIPIIGGLIATLFVGRGVYVLLERRRSSSSGVIA